MVIELAKDIYSGPGPYKVNSRGILLDPQLLLTAFPGQLNHEQLGGLAHQSIVTVDALPRRTVIEVSRFAAQLELTEVSAHHPLDGKLVITAFFEASTRTRLSFEAAVLRLDGKVVSVQDGRMTGVAKGESLADIGEMFNTYGDLVIMRHTDTDAMDRIRCNLQLPLINAGNGTGEHPTQALTDWYTLLKWRPQLATPNLADTDRIDLGVVGTPSSMRAVKSFMRLGLAFQHAIRSITVVSEMADPLGPELAAELDASGVDCRVVHDIKETLPSFDVIYMNSIALLGGSYRKMDSRFKLHAKSPLKPGAVILHPLARREELDPGLDATPHNLYFAQAASAVFVRQALLIALLGRLDRIRGHL